MAYVDTSQVLCDVLFLSLSWNLCNNLHKVSTNRVLKHYATIVVIQWQLKQFLKSTSQHMWSI